MHKNIYLLHNLPKRYYQVKISQTHKRDSIFEFQWIASRITICWSQWSDFYSSTINIKNKRRGHVSGIETVSIYIRLAYHVYKRPKEFRSRWKVRKM